MAQRQHYQEIADYLRGAINSGELPPGAMLPSEAELCKKFSSARGTVRQAMQVLRSEGLVSSGQGRRSRVLKSLPSQSFDDVISFTQWCKSAGIEPGQRTQWVVKKPASETLANELGLEAGAPAVSVFRLRLMDGEPAMVERLNYTLDVGVHVLTFDTDEGSIYQHLKDSGVDIASAVRTIDAIPATKEDAELLGVAEGSPLLRVRRRAFDSAGVALESSDDRYRFDLASFTVTSTQGAPQAVSLGTREPDA